MQLSPLERMDRKSSRFMGRSRQRDARSTRATAVTVALVVLGLLVAWGLWALGGAKHAGQFAQRAVQAVTQPSARKIEQTAGEGEAADAASAKSRAATITVAAVGDMVFDGAVKDLISSSGGDAPLADVSDDLSGADVTIGSLESQLSSRGEADATQTITYQGDPKAIEGLTKAGFDFVSLANDHVMDYGSSALEDSINSLNEAAIGHAGAGMTRTGAWRPATFESNGVRVAYLAFGHVTPPGYIAGPRKPGMASGKSDLPKIEKAIRDAKASNDYVIVSFHWGEQYVEQPADAEIEKAHAAVDAGADMVLATHPRVIQGVEFYKKRLIAYSLGDFVFDHTLRKTGESFILHASLGPDGVTGANARPIYIGDQGKPGIVTGSDATAILEQLRTISEPFGTKVRVSESGARLLP